MLRLQLYSPLPALPLYFVALSTIPARSFFPINVPSLNLYVFVWLQVFCTLPQLLYDHDCDTHDTTQHVFHITFLNPTAAYLLHLNPCFEWSDIQVGLGIQLSLSPLYNLESLY